MMDVIGKNKIRA